MAGGWRVAWLPLLVALLACGLLRVSGAAGTEGGAGRHAYATLLYGDEFLLGARVLGQSLRESGTPHPMVVLVSAGVTEQGVQLLQGDGWIVKRVELVANPSKKFPTRFWGVYTKLSIFNLTDYDRVVYLDADSIVVRSVDDAFTCQGFCAVLRHSERLNSGFMVVEPSSALYQDMMTKIEALPSYTGGDQGFLNAYYEGFINSPLYEPDKSTKSDGKTMHRLPTAFNGDIGLYVLNSNKWMVPEVTLRMIHYTLGPLKPWDWWTGFLLPPVAHWHAMRRRLPTSVPGDEAGISAALRFRISLITFLPLLLTAFLARKWLLSVYRSLLRGQLLNHRRGAVGLQLYGGASQQGHHSPSHQYGAGAAGGLRLPPYLEPLSVAVCFATALLALATAAFVVPRQVPPWTGLLLMYEVLFFVFGLLFCKYLELLHFWGRATAHPDAAAKGSPKGRGKGGPPCDWEPSVYFGGMAGLAILTPCLPYLAGISSIFGRLGAVLVGGFLLVTFLTYASQKLAVRAFSLGRVSSPQAAVDPWDL